MEPRILLLPLVAALLAAPALGYHSAGNGTVGTDTGPVTFHVPLATAVWWDYSSVLGVPTGVDERTRMLEVSNGAPVTITAETFPVATPDTPMVCLPSRTPDIVVPALVVHGMSCVKYNGYSVHIHYFPWTLDPEDPDHVVSPAPAAPAAVSVWRVDLPPLSYKEAVLPPGHWQVWIDPAVALPAAYDITYRATSSQPFYYDHLGHRGCPFYVTIADMTDQDLLQCPLGYA